eukprot:Polyplicarium_translucidae@DN455_c0_g1_i2.p1
MSHEVSCMDVTDSIIAVALWGECSALLFSSVSPFLDQESSQMPPLTLLCRCPLPSERVWRGVPVASVFATGDRPTMLYARPGRRILFSTVNWKEIHFFTVFNVEPLLRPQSPAESGDVATLQSGKTPNAVHSACNSALSVAWATPHQLRVGLMDDAQRLHIRSMKIGLTPDKVAYNKEHNLIAVGAVCEWQNDDPQSLFDPTVLRSGEDNWTDADARMESDECEGTAESPLDERNYLLLANPKSHAIVNAHCLEATEHPASLLSCTLPEACEGEVVILGTAFVLPEESEVKRGAIRIFQISNRGPLGFRLEEVWRTYVDGAAYSMRLVEGKLVVGVNNMLKVYAVGTAAERPLALSSRDSVNCLGCEVLKCVASHGAHSQVYEIDSCGDAIVVGDLQRSAGLCRFNEKLGALEEVARDFNSVWVMAVACLSPTVFLLSDDSKNLIVLTVNEDATTEEQRCRLSQVGLFHSGEQVNKIVAEFAEKDLPDLILPQWKDTDRDYAPVQRAVWGSVSGALGYVSSLKSERQFARLAQIEDAVAQCVQPVAELKHSEWRSYSAGMRQLTSRGFIDGDTVELLLELPRQLQTRIFEILARSKTFYFPSLEALLNEVEELQRMH